MAEWPGGECPACGESMPARQIHCRLCLALLCDKTDASDLWERKYVPQLSGVHRLSPREPAAS